MFENELSFFSFWRATLPRLQDRICHRHHTQGLCERQRGRVEVVGTTVDHIATLGKLFYTGS